MKRFKLLVLAGVAGICLAASAPKAEAQISINIGVAPVCPYGYFDYAPYPCAPFGYYGPQWFVGGVFVGAGRWFHGPEHFRGYVNRDFDPRFGYRGHLPERGEHADWGRHRGWDQHFRGNGFREESRHDNGNHYGQDKDHGDRHGNGHGEGHGNGHGNGHGDGHGNDHGHGHGHD